MVSERTEGSLDLYPFPMKVSVSSFVTIKLTDQNYLLWKTQVESLLSSQRLLGFVTGKEKSPKEVVRMKFEGKVTEVSNPDYESWFQSDQLVRSWLFSTLSEEVLGYVHDVKTSYDVWYALAENFNRCSISREFDLLTSLQLITKGDRVLADYLKEFKDLCDKLSSIGKPVSEPMKIFRLLQGLGREYESFATVMQASMHRPPAPTYADVVSQLQGFDNRIKSYSPIVQSVNPHLAFQVQQQTSPQELKTGGNTYYFNRGRGNRGNFRGRGGFSTRGRGFPQQVSLPSPQWNNNNPHNTQQYGRPTCQICGRIGHIALKCWNRFDNAYQSEDIPQALAAMHISSPQQWYPDSGATSHITNTTEHLQDTTSYSGSENVMVADGNFLPITHVGSTSLSTTSESVDKGKKA